MFSLANTATLVSEVASPVVEFAARWVQSPSSYDQIVAATIPREWALAHRPVISRSGGEHALYKQFLLTEPKGMIVRCHMNCAQECKIKSVDGKRWRFICRVCNSRATIEKDFCNTTTPLGRNFIVKTPYPELQHPVTWSLPPPPKADSDLPGQAFPIPARFQVPAQSSRSTHLRAPDMVERAVSLPERTSHTTSMATPGASTSSLRIRIPPPAPTHVLHHTRSTSAMADRRNPGSLNPPPTPVEPAEAGPSAKRLTGTQSSSKRVKRSRQ